jgi:hypothetical protein
MKIKYLIKDEHSHLRLEVSGEWAKGNEAKEAISIWSQIAEACRELGSSRVLAIFDVSGRMPAMEAWDIASDLQSVGLERHWRIAVVYTHQERFESNHFSEDVACNRGYDVKIFRDESSAESWLQRP